MRFIERHDVVRASFVLVLIPLLAAIDGCGTEVPIGSDTGGGSPSAGGSGGTGAMSATGSTATAGGSGMGGAGGAGGMSGTGAMTGTSSTATAGGTGMGGAGGVGGAGGTGGVLVCQPNTMVACYWGPPGTQNVGQCKAGTQTCNSDGMSYGPCIGQVLPSAEICDAAMQDEDCDGLSGCQCGDGTLDPGESCDDGNVLDGDMCPATCLRSVVKIEGGGVYTCALLDDGRRKCWGRNFEGQLGVGDDQNRGDGPNEMGDNLPVANLGTGKTVVAYVPGAGHHNCAHFSDSSVKCWGWNWAGQLGLGDTEDRGDYPSEMGDNLPIVNLGTGETAVAIAAAGQHTCVLLTGGRVKCWGNNSYGQLGLGDSNYRGDNPGEMGDNLPIVNLGTGKTAVMLVPGDFHMCALLNDNSVKCWGYNVDGELGLGDTNNRGDNPGEMGDNLPAVDFGTGKTAVAITSYNSYHNCAFLNDNTVKCWGQNSYGQLGLGDSNHRGDAPNEMGDKLPAVDLGTGKNAVAIRLGHWHTCAVLSDGTAKCWGYNESGRLGLGDTNHRGDDLDEMGDFLPTVNLGATMPVLAIMPGAYHTCALLNGGRMKCWGPNESGQLGLGDTNNRGDNPGEMGDNLPFVAP